VPPKIQKSPLALRLTTKCLVSQLPSCGAGHARKSEHSRFFRILGSSWLNAPISITQMPLDEVPTPAPPCPGAARSVYRLVLERPAPYEPSHRFYPSPGRNILTRYASSWIVGASARFSILPTTPRRRFTPNAPNNTYCLLPPLGRQVERGTCPCIREIAGASDS